MPDVVKIEHKENSSSYRVHPVYDQSTAHIQKMVLEQRDKYEHQNRVNLNYLFKKQTKTLINYFYFRYLIKIGIQINKFQIIVICFRKLSLEILFFCI